MFFFWLQQIKYFFAARRVVFSRVRDDYSNSIQKYLMWDDECWEWKMKNEQTTANQNHTHTLTCDYSAYAAFLFYSGSKYFLINTKSSTLMLTCPYNQKKKNSSNQKHFNKSRALILTNNIITWYKVLQGVLRLFFFFDSSWIGLLLLFLSLVYNNSNTLTLFYQKSKKIR